jgi:hypothetical protein
MVLQLARFVVWPEAAPQTSQFRFCVLGSNKFLETLQQVVQHESVHGRRIVTSRIEGSRDLTGCEVAYVAAATERDLQGIFDGRPELPVLTASDLPGFAARGGMVALVAQEGRIGIEINRESGERAGLQFSSRLLKLARIVRTSGVR